MSSICVAIVTNLSKRIANANRVTYHKCYSLQRLVVGQPNNTGVSKVGAVWNDSAHGRIA